MTAPALAAALALALAAPAAMADELVFHANGESLATGGFLAPELTRDGWELRFDSILVTLDGVAAFQSDPPHDAAGGSRPEGAVTVALDTGGPVTLDLLDTGPGGRVRIGSVPAPAGHYNALAWSIVPAPEGAWAGQSMVLSGTAMRDGQAVPFVLTGAGTWHHACGEYVGDARKGFVAPGSGGELELTFHLDHIFGRADREADDPMNTGARGFDTFAGGGTQVLDLSGLHVGHVGEGHCAVTQG